jgi:hypothetical protein
VLVTDIFNRRNEKTLEPTGYLPSFVDALVEKELLDLQVLYGKPAADRAAPRGKGTGKA